LRDSVGSRSIRGKIHSSKQGMLTPCPGELVGAFFGDHEIAGRVAATFSRSTFSPQVR